MAKLGGKYPAKAIKTLKSTATRITKFNNRKIDGKGVYTIYVVAMKREGGKETELAKSIVGIVAGGKDAKYTNVRSITLKTKTLSVAAGASAKIKAKTVRVDKKKKLADKKTKEFRYASSDNSIATVDENGNVTGVKAGTCKVYVYSKNGLAKAVSVTVK
ncbi:MAG: hypothetical protein E7294_09540 [Lachnospiraceae bacterium]|nr:hypothetical protein [Lachnospiraceae bacterium]